MNAQKSSAEKNAKNNQKSGWFEVDYSSIIKESFLIVRHNFRLLIITAVLIVLTGGQSLTLNSSLLKTGNLNFNDFRSLTDQKNQNGDGKDFQKVLDEIRNQENLKIKIREFTQNKEMVNQAIFFGTILVVFIFILWLLGMFYNSFLHILFFKKADYILEKRIWDEKEARREVKGRWKKLVFLRLIFIFLNFISFLIFISPAGFFAWERQWLKSIPLAILALILIGLVSVFLSYVYRLSFFYLLQSKLSVKESIDRGYELFGKKWKPVVSASFITFALNMIAGLCAFLAFLFFILITLIFSVLIVVLAVLIFGEASSGIIVLTLATLLILTPTLLFAMILSASWQSFLMIFWLIVWKEIAGARLTVQEDPETVFVKREKTVQAVKKEMASKQITEK